MFLRRTNSWITILFVYVDDIIIIGTDYDGISKLQVFLHASLQMKNLGNLTYYMSIKFMHPNKEIFINQHKYTKDLIALARLEDFIPVDTPLKVNVIIKCHRNDAKILSDPTLYRRLDGSLVYLVIT